MKTNTGHRGRKRGREAAARWYVDVVDRPAPRRRERRFLRWLARDERNADALARCDAAIAIARGLANDPEVGWAFREAQWLAQRREHPRRRRRLSSPALAWGVAAACAALAVLSHVPLAESLRQQAPAVPAIPDSVSLALASAHPAIVLPGQVVVDANSVAILPFSSGTDPRAGDVAATLHADLVRTLAGIPGLYAVGGETVAPYAGTDLVASEIAAQLGTRGIATGTVAVGGGRVGVTLRLTDASTGRILLEAAYERAASDLHALEREMATGIALALAHTTHPSFSAANN